MDTLQTAIPHSIELLSLVYEYGDQRIIHSGFGGAKFILLLMA